MRIIGFNFKEIKAERKKDIKGSLKIKSGLNIEGIEKENLDIAGDVLKFNFEYKITFEPDFAEIKFKGFVLLSPDDAKQILKDWKKKKIADAIRLPVFNFIMNKCDIKALQLEEDFALPHHVPLPHLTNQPSDTPSKNQANYTG